MKRYARRWLAFALAAALTVGDCIPAMAAAPAGVTEAELSEEALSEEPPQEDAAPGETVTDGSEEETAPAEELPEQEPVPETKESEEPGQQEPEAPEMSEGSGAAEAAKTYADTEEELEKVTIEEGTKLFMSEKSKYVMAQVKETGYYSVQSSIYNLYRGIMVTCVTDKTMVDNIPGTPREDDIDVPNAYYLEEGKEYRMSFSSEYPGEEYLTFHQTEIPEFDALTIGTDISVEANQWEFLRLEMRNEESFYLGISEERAANGIEQWGNISQEGNVIEAGERYWKKYTIYGSGNDSEVCYLVLSPRSAAYVINCRAEVEIPKEDTKVLKNWDGQITVPAGQKKTIICSPRYVGTYIMSYREKAGVTFSITDTGKGEALNWKEGETFRRSYSYGYRKSEDESFGTITAVVDNQSADAVTVGLTCDEHTRRLQELGVGETADISDTTSGPHYFSFTAPEDGYYWIDGPDTLWKYRNEYMNKSIYIGLETGYFPLKGGGEQLYFAMAGETEDDTVQVKKAEDREVQEIKGTQLLVEKHCIFRPTCSGEYICTGTGDTDVYYYDFYEERWVKWQDGESMYLADTVDYYLWSEPRSGKESVIQLRDSVQNWSKAKALTAGKTTAVAAKDGIQYFTFTAPATDLYYVTAAEGTTLRKVYNRYGYSKRNENELGLEKGEQLWIEVVSKEGTGSLTVERRNAKQVSGEQFRTGAAQNYIVFTPSLPGTYYYTVSSGDADVEPEYLTKEEYSGRDIWKTWEAGTGMELAVGHPCFFRNLSGSSVRVYCMEAQPTSLKVTPESTTLVLPYDATTGGWKGVTSSAAVTGVVTDEKDNVFKKLQLDTEKVSWNLTAPSGKKEELGDSSEFTVTETGTYTLRAVYQTGNGAYAEGTAEIEVTADKIPYPHLQPVTLSLASNVDKNLTLGQIYEKLTAETKANLSNGDLVFTDQKGKVLSEKTKLVKGVNKWVAHYYLHEEDPYYLGETTVSVVITYGDLKLKKLESSNGATIAQKTVRSTAYQNSTLVKPVYTLNGAEVSQNDLSRFGYEERREVSGKKDGILSAAEEGADDEYYYRVVGEETGKDTLIWNSRFTSSLTGSTAVLSSTLAMKVAGEEASAVQGIDLWINDEKCGAGDEDDPETVWQVLAEDVKSAKQEYELTVGAVDFSGAPADTAITWTTSNKSVAYVTKAKDGSIKLVIPKGMKGGIARITATAKDYHKAGASFTVQVVDDDFRLETTRLTLNSNSREFRTIRLYGNKAYLETKQAVQPTVEVRAVKKNGELDDRFQFETSETPGENGAVEVKSILKDGTLGVQFREPQKAGTTTMILELHLFDGTNVDVTKKVTISVTNKPTVPKTAAKVTRGYNPFWNGNEAYAKVLLTTAEAVQEDKIRLEEGSGYQIVDLDLVDNDYGLIWEATLKAENPDKVKTGNVAFQVSYDPDQYRINEISVNAKIPVKNSTPTAAVYGDNIWDAFWFPETGETAMDVLVELPDGMEPSEITDVALTAAGQKNFEVSSWEPEEYPYVKKNGKYMELNAALRVHLVSKTGKTGNVQFVLCSDSCSKPIMSKTKAVTAKKLSGEKAVIYDAVTGKSTSAYTLQMARAGKEAIRVSVYDRNLERYPTDVKVEGGDVLTTSMLGAGSITVEKSEYINDTYLIRTTEDAFRWGAKSCRLKFTVSIEDEETGESYSLKPVTLTINLKSQKTLPAMKATVKTVGTLDAANRENEAELKISIQNLPQGAEITKVQLTGYAAKLPYGLAPDFEGNTVILGLMEEGEVPIGKNKVELLCTVRLADGSCVQVPAMATVNVTQKATVKVSQKSATLYSAVDNPEYENLLQIVVENAGENELEFTGVRGPEGKGIYAGYDETTQAIVISPNEMEPLHAGSYKYVYTFTLKHSGTKVGSKMIYSVPVVVTVKK